MTREELFFTHIEHIGEQQVPLKEEFKAGGAVRKSPIESATSVQEGTVAYGSDGAFYFTKKDKNGVQRWQKIAGTDGALNGLKVFSYDQILTGTKGDYDGIAYQRFFLLDTAQVPLAYIVYRLDSNNTKFELLNSPVNRTLVDNDSPFWASSAQVEKEIFDFATTKFASTAAKILAKNIVSDIDYLDTLFRKIDNEVRDSMDSNIGLTFDLSIIDNYRAGIGLPKLTPTEAVSTTASTSHKFQVGDKVTIVDAGERITNWTEKFDLLNFDSPKSEHNFGDEGDEGIVFATSNNGTQNIYGVKIIKGRDLGAQILITEAGLRASSGIAKSPIMTAEMELQKLIANEVYEPNIKESDIKEALYKTEYSPIDKLTIAAAFGNLSFIKNSNPVYNRFAELWKIVSGESVQETDYYYEYSIKPEFEQFFEENGLKKRRQVDMTFSNRGLSRFVDEYLFRQMDYFLLEASIPQFKDKLFELWLKNKPTESNQAVTPQIDITKDYKFEAKTPAEAKMFFGWAMGKGAVWMENSSPDEDVFQTGYYYINDKDIKTGISKSDFEEDEGRLLTMREILSDLENLSKQKETPDKITDTTQDAEKKKTTKTKKTNTNTTVNNDFTQLPEKSLQEIEKEYDDLMFLISVTPAIDVVTVINLKQSAKALKDQINVLLMAEKDKMLDENRIFDELFTASSIQPKHRYNLKPYIDGFAPDGTPTKLPPKVYDLVLTDDFENWFGDFQMAYQFKNTKYREVPCSIVKNEHFEPQIVFHGTGSVFSFFDFNKFPAMYFAENYHYAEWFATQKGASEGHEGYVYPFLLNIRNPLDLTMFGINQVSPQEFMDSIYLQCGLKEEDLKINAALVADKNRKFEAWVYLRNSPEMLKVFRDTKLFDGIVYFEQNPPIDPTANNYKTKGFIIFEASNAKIVDPERHDLLLGNMRSFYLKKGGKI